MKVTCISDMQCLSVSAAVAAPDGPGVHMLCREVESTLQDGEALAAEAGTEAAAEGMWNPGGGST